MPNDNRKRLAKYRLEKSGDCIKAAENLLASDMLVHSVNRSYYAIFHTIRAVLALEGVDFKKHSAVIAYFQQHYVKTGLFENKYSDFARDAFSIRADSDYEDFFVVSKEDAEEQIVHAKQFLNAAEVYFTQIVNTHKIPFEISLPKYYSVEDVAGENWRDGLDEMEDEWE